MESRTGRLEDVPPLELREIRSLDLREPAAEGKGAHVASASGLIRRGDHLYAIGDDLLHLAVFRMSDPSPGEVARIFTSTEPGDDGRPGKPDLEVLTVLPPFPGHAFGALFGLGSGSAPGRDRGFVWRLAADGSLAGEPRTVDLAPVYDRLRRDVEALNVEGAAVMGERLWLLNRGNRDASANVVAELSLDAVMTSLRSDLRLDVHELEAIRSYDIGTLDGVPLAFSDATSLGGELLLFTASAEGEGDGGPDGAIRGSVVGTIGGDGDVRRLRTIDRRYKVEGVHATIETGVVDLLFVCDQDDPAEPSPLLSAAMPIDAAVDRDSGDDD